MPRPLAVAAGWAWRVAVLAVVIYEGARVLGHLEIVTIPCAIALLITALLQPVAARLRRVGASPMAATWLAILIVFVVVAGVGLLIGFRAQTEFPTLINETVHTAKQFQGWLRNGPLHINQHQLDAAFNTVVQEVEKQRSRLAGTVVTGATVLFEVLAALVLTMFITFFLTKDGDRIWSWLLDRCNPAVRDRIDRAGRVSWQTLAQYVHGTVIIAAIHGLVLGVVMLIMGIPLWAPMAVLIFLGSFIPLVGIFITGGLAVAVTLGTQGWTPALILLIVLVVEAQAESHLLQPQIVGRMIKLHPLVVILALAIGTIVASIIGAVVAVPIVAIVYRAWPELRRAGPAPPDPPKAPPPERPGPPGATGDAPATGDATDTGGAVDAGSAPEGG